VNFSTADGEKACLPEHTSLSFADAAIAVIARTRADGQVLTFDAGFRGIKGLRPEPAK